MQEVGLFGPSSASAQSRAGEAYPGNTDTVIRPDLKMEENIAQVLTPSLRLVVWTEMVYHIIFKILCEML